ncbi:MAG: hypothetical protein ABEJ79_00025 [Halolamina sp.]
MHTGVSTQEAAAVRNSVDVLTRIAESTDSRSHGVSFRRLRRYAPDDNELLDVIERLSSRGLIDCRVRRDSATGDARTLPRLEHAVVLSLTAAGWHALAHWMDWI